MSAITDIVTNPDLLDAEAVLASMIPEVGPLAAAALHMLAAAIRAKVSVSEVNAITAMYSAQAQQLADAW